MVKEYKFSAEQVKQMEEALKKGRKLEVIPTKEGIKIMNVERHELKTK